MLALTLVAWIPAAVLCVSGALKFGRTDRFAASLRDMQLGWFSSKRWFVRGFSLLEIALGAFAILGSSFTQLAALPMLGIHAVFLIAVLRIAAAGITEVVCECFGGLDDGKIGWPTVARNAALVGAAFLGLFGAPARPEFALAGFLLAALVAGMLVLVRNRREAARRSRLLAALTLTTADGTVIPFAEFQQPSSYLAFFSPRCSSCRELVEQFRLWPHGLKQGAELYPVLLGSPEEFGRIREFESIAPYALYDSERRVARAVGMRGTPGMVLVDAQHPFGDGWVLGGVAMEAYAVRPGFFEELRDAGA